MLLCFAVLERRECHDGLYTIILQASLPGLPPIDSAAVLVKLEVFASARSEKNLETVCRTASSRILESRYGFHSGSRRMTRWSPSNISLALCATMAYCCRTPPRKTERCLRASIGREEGADAGWSWNSTAWRHGGSAMQGKTTIFRHYRPIGRAEPIGHDGPDGRQTRMRARKGKIAPPSCVTSKLPLGKEIPCNSTPASLSSLPRSYR